MNSHEIHRLLHEYGLALVFSIVALQALGVPLPGTTALVAAALYAATSHGLPIVGVIVAGAAGALAGTTVSFALGRWGGERLLLGVGRRLRQSPERVQQLRLEFAVHGGAVLFFGRFITGVRNLTGLAAGASGMRLGRFVTIAGAAACAWALLNSLEYYWFGRAIAQADTWVQVVLICAGLAWMVLSLAVLRSRALRRIRAGGLAVGRRLTRRFAAPRQPGVAGWRSRAPIWHLTRCHNDAILASWNLNHTLIASASSSRSPPKLGATRPARSRSGLPPHSTPGSG